MAESIPKVTGMERVGEPVRVSKERYVSADYAARERERLWPRVWQIACRSDDVAAPGDWFEYAIADQSYLVVRDEAGAIRAFHNVCLHRGNRLATGCGRGRKLTCPFHRWSWNLDGSLNHVPFAERVGDLDAGAYRLPELRVGTWGGFVFVNPSHDGPGLDEWLGPVPAQLAAYRLEAHTRTQDFTIRVPANWKTSLDAFLEAYHVPGIHPQLLPFFDDVNTFYELLDPHSRMLSPVGTPSPRLGGPGEVSKLDLFRAMVINASGSDTELGRAEDPEAVARALAALEIPDGMSLRDFLVAGQRAQAGARGLDFSDLSDDQVMGDWHYHLFPNAIFNIYAGNFWFFRMRPDAEDPHRMLFDFQDYHWIADADEAAARRSRHRSVEIGEHSFGAVLDQDLALIPGIQAGLRSRALRELTLSSMEMRIEQMHRVLDRFLGEATDATGATGGGS